MQQTLEWKNKTKGQASIHLMPGSNRGLGAHLTLQFLRHFFPLECSKQLFPERNAKTGDRARPEIQNKLFPPPRLLCTFLFYTSTGRSLYTKMGSNYWRPIWEDWVLGKNFAIKPWRHDRRRGKQIVYIRSSPAVFEMHGYIFLLGL